MPERTAPPRSLARGDSLKPLAAQCQRLRIPLQHLRAPSLENPEQFVLSVYRGKGFCGAMCEGGPVLLLMKSLTLDILEQFNSFGSREDACTRHLEAQFTILAEHAAALIACARRTSPTQMLKNFAEVYSHAFVRECYPDVYPDLLLGLLKALGTERLTNIIERFCHAPYDYRSGWPDLTLVRRNELRFIEVKTSDRLHASQIRWIETFRPMVPDDVYSVVQVVKT